MLATALATSCKKDDGDGGETEYFFDNEYWNSCTDTIVTGPADDITYFSAKMKGRITFKETIVAGLGNKETHGVLISESVQDSTMVFGAEEVEAVVCKSQAKLYTVEATGLKMGTRYYYRAYAHNTKLNKYHYGRVFYFTTLMGKAETLEAQDVTPYSADVYGSSSIDIRDERFDGEVGIVYTTRNTDRPSIEVDKIAVGHMVADDSTRFVVELDTLTEQTKYTYMAYLRIGTEYYYGGVRSFSTSKFEISTASVVDLGLSSGTLWASMNVGASSVTDAGTYFAWGDPTGEVFEVDNTDLYFTANVYDLSSDKDMATQNVGVGYRTPSVEQMKELLNSCEWHWTTYNGVNGYVVRGVNGQTIFLPTGGELAPTTSGDRNLVGVGISGNYWTGSRTLFSKAYHLTFDRESHAVGERGPWFGFNVRAVVSQ